MNLEIGAPIDVDIDTSPKKLEWNLTPELRIGVRFAETRLSDLICQNDCQALEFKGYGKVGNVSCDALQFLNVFTEFHHSSWFQSGCFCANGVPGSVLWSLW